MGYPYSSALTYIGVAVQSAVGTPAAAPSMFLEIERAQTKMMEWLVGRTEVDYATGDYYTEVDAPITKPHSAGTLVLPAKLSQLDAFLAMGGIAGGAAPGAALVPPSPMTIFQGLGGNEEIYSDVFFSGQPVFSVSDTATATWNIPLLGMTQPTDHAIRIPNFLVYEEPWRLSDLRAATLILATSVVRFSSFKATLIIDIEPQYYSRGDGLPNPSDMTLVKLGGFLDFRVAYNGSTERAAFLNACGQPGALTFPFSRTCGSTTNTLQFGLTNGLHTVRTLDAPSRAMVGETFTTRGLRGPTTPYSPIQVAYT
jgi:hypothetical protein